MRLHTTIKHHMTPSPITIGGRQTMTTAHRLMRDNHIRHLPVLDEGRVIGVVTERDLHLMESLRDVEPDDVFVEDAMTPDPYTVSPDAHVGEVATTMANNKFGCAIVVENGRACGVFTTVDALRALADMVGRQGKPARARAAG